MYIHKIFVQILIIISMHAYLFADQVLLLDGTRLEGKILSADQNCIYLQITDNDISNISHQLVKSVFFNFADLVYLQTGQVLECKIVNRTVTGLIAMTEQGSLTIKFVSLRTFYYNASDSLEIPFLLPTSDIFHNDKIYRPVIKPAKKVSGKHFNFGINTGVAFTPDAEWKSSSVEGFKPPGFIKGLDLEYSLKPHLILHLGYDYIEYRNINHEDLPGLIKRQFINLGFAFKNLIPFLHNCYYSAGLGVGLNSLSGRSNPLVNNDPDSIYKSVSLKDLGTKIAIKTYLEAETFIAVRLILRLQFSYLIAMPFDLGPGLDYNYPKKITIDFSGAAITFHLLYQIPI